MVRNLAEDRFEVVESSARSRFKNDDVLSWISIVQMRIAFPFTVTIRVGGGEVCASQFPVRTVRRIAAVNADRIRENIKTTSKPSSITCSGRILRSRPQRVLHNCLARMFSRSSTPDQMLRVATIVITYV
jgi:hypothetical protein